MNESARQITFDSRGHCNYCKSFPHSTDSSESKRELGRNVDLHQLIQQIKTTKAIGSKYDCIIGISGGVDSAYTLIKAVELGLRPLVVHMDNGWNSELAVSNIYNLIKRLNLDLKTYVIQWECYKSILRSFISANVIDLELLYDNAMLAVNYQYAKDLNLKYVLTGDNRSSEGMPMPEAWNWNKFDGRNIVSIHRKHGDGMLGNFPLLTINNWLKFSYIDKIKTVPILNYIEYDKVEATRILVSSYGFKTYPYKHGESIFTRFYQGYILPKKFDVDKRRLHLSSLIMSGQISREEAILELDSEPLAGDELDRELKFVCKKLDIKIPEFQRYLTEPETKHSSYGNDRIWFDFFLRLYLKLPVCVKKLLKISIQ